MASKKPAKSGDRKLIERLLIAFEQSAHTDENGQQYWLARELQAILGYSSWQRFEAVIERAKAALDASDGRLEDHFNNVVKVITAGKGAQHERADVELSRRACYLIGINGDPSKLAAIAAIQQYFVERTRAHEIDEMLALAGDDRDRLETHRKYDAADQDLRNQVASRVTQPNHVEQVRTGRCSINRPRRLKSSLAYPRAVRSQIALSR